VSEGSKPGESGAEIRPAPEGYHTVTPWIISRDAARLLDFVRGVWCGGDSPNPQRGRQHRARRVPDL
jgi:hypothetical protein